MNPVLPAYAAAKYLSVTRLKSIDTFRRAGLVGLCEFPIVEDPEPTPEEIAVRKALAFVHDQHHGEGAAEDPKNYDGSCKHDYLCAYCNETLDDRLQMIREGVRLIDSHAGGFLTGGVALGQSLAKLYALLPGSEVAHPASFIEDWQLKRYRALEKAVGEAISNYAETFEVRGEQFEALEKAYLYPVIIPPAPAPIDFPLSLHPDGTDTLYCKECEHRHQDGDCGAELNGPCPYCVEEAAK